MRALATGHIVASRHPDWAVGDAVTGWFGSQEVATVPASAIVRRIDETDLPLSPPPGLLGINGIPAPLPLTKAGQRVSRNTVVVSTPPGRTRMATGARQTAERRKAVACRE